MLSSQCNAAHSGQRHDVRVRFAGRHRGLPTASRAEPNPNDRRSEVTGRACTSRAPESYPERLARGRKVSSSASRPALSRWWSSARAARTPAATRLGEG